MLFLSVVLACTDTRGQLRMTKGVYVVDVTRTGNNSDEE